uniref:Uncharacterized protein n=1 Tax=Arundo donax TaxID=35708 RepID=A0A0A9CCC5_ARUDO
MFGPNGKKLQTETPIVHLAWLLNIIFIIKIHASRHIAKHHVY